MCMTYTAKLRRGSKREGYGWKIFKKYDDNVLRFEYGSLNSSSIVPVNKWLKAPAWDKAYGSHYDTGYGVFHVFPTRAAAERWYDGESLKIIKRVRYRKALVEGRQWDDRCLGVREIRVAWPGKKNSTS